VWVSRIVRPVSAVAQQAVSAALHRHLSTADMTDLSSPVKGTLARRVEVCVCVRLMPPIPPSAPLPLR
jgi:hypothetical protein